MRFSALWAFILVVWVLWTARARIGETSNPGAASTVVLTSLNVNSLEPHLQHVKDLAEGVASVLALQEARFSLATQPRLASALRPWIGVWGTPTDLSYHQLPPSDGLAGTPSRPQAKQGGVALFGLGIPPIQPSLDGQAAELFRTSR